MKDRSLANLYLHLQNAVFQSSGPTDAPMNDTLLDHSAFATAHSQSGYRPKQRPLCTYCSQLGHIVTKCFKLHGFPPGHRNNKTSARGSGFTPRGQQGYNQRPAQTSHHPLSQQFQKSNDVAQITANAVNPNPVQIHMDPTHLQHLNHPLVSSPFPLLAFVLHIISLLSNINAYHLFHRPYYLIPGSLTVELLHMYARICPSLVVPRLCLVLQSLSLMNLMKLSLI